MTITEQNKKYANNKPKCNIYVNNKPKCDIIATLTFYEEEPKENTFGSNNIVYEIYLKKENDKEIQIWEIGAFGDRQLTSKVKKKDKTSFTLEDINKISCASYKEFVEHFIEGGK